MSTLNLATVELVSTLREAPMNGSPSSADYNDSWTESLADLASLSGFINDILLPMLNGLIGTIQPSPTAAPLGLEGRFIFGDTTDQTSLFYDDLSDTSLSIADSLRVLNGVVTTVSTAITNLTVQVTSLQTLLSSTNQNDISTALQNFSASLQNTIARVTANTQSISSATETLGKQQRIRVTTGPIVNGTPVTVFVPFPTPYPDENYTFNLTLQDPSGHLSMSQIQEFSSEIFDLNGGTAKVVAGVATLTFPQIYSYNLNIGDSVVITGSGTDLDSTTGVLLTATLTAGVWTITFNTSATAFSMVSLTTGTVADATEAIVNGAGVSALITSASGTNTGTLHLIAIHD